MKWENLLKNKCPYDHAALDFSREGVVLCTKCRFSATIARFNSLRRHRSNAKTEKKNKWQNLHEGRCPSCGAKLFPERDTNTGLTMFKCVGSCDFIISARRVQEILADPDHSANIFRDNLDAEIEGLVGEE